MLTGFSQSVTEALAAMRQAKERKDAQQAKRNAREDELREDAPKTGRMLATRILRSSLLKPQEYVALGMAYDRLIAAGVIATGGRTLQTFDDLRALWRFLGQQSRRR